MLFSPTLINRISSFASRYLTSTIIVLCFFSIPVLLSTQIAPNKFYLAGFISLTIPVFVGGILFSFFYFVLKKSRWSILPLLIVIFFWPLISDFFGLRSEQAPISKNSISIISYNVRGFKDKARPKKKRDSQAEITHWLDTLGADIICLQEASDPAQMQSVLVAFQGFFSGKTNLDSSTFGVMILSRFPMVDKGSIEFAHNSFNRCVWADIVVNSDTIRIMNVHLKSYVFQDYRRWEKLKTMRDALIGRSYHIGLLTRFIEQSPYPVILAGDFNETSHSYVYQKLNSILKNTFEYSGTFFQHSFALGPIPFRIDHIFVDAKFSVLNYNTHYEHTWSDHYPIEATLGF